MWFKNLAVYRFTEAFQYASDDLEQKLQQHLFRPCAAHDEFSMGWCSPLGKTVEALTYASNGFVMFCAKKEEKLIPSAVVNEMLQERISEIEDKEARKIPQKERSRIKDELIFELLPKAFSFSRKTYGYIDIQNGWLVVDAASAKKAEDLLSLLRKSVGALSVVPINTGTNPTLIMTDWLLNNSTPNDIVIEDECELRAREQEGSIIRCKRHDLALPEIKNHLDTGKMVIKLAFSWADRLSLILDESLMIKRLKFLDLIQDQMADINTDNDIEQFDAEFAIMTAELAQFLPRILSLFNTEVGKS